MNEMRALIATEAKLLFREPIYWLVVILLPTAILLIIGLVFQPKPDPALGGERWLDLFVPSLLVITTATLAIQTLPIRLATYREKGVLRRLSTTPAHPARLLIAQLVVYAATAVAGLVLLLVTGWVAFGIALPENPIGYAAAFVVGLGALFAIGLVVAAFAPSTGVATAIVLPVFFVVMFLGGVYIPRQFLPEVLMRIGDFTPPNVQGLLDAWAGATPQLLPLGGMVAVIVVAGAIAVRIFRWE
jgi:ABC-2 type transport system permease protein